MKLDYLYNDLSNLLAQSDSKNDSNITSVAFDSRRISNGEGVLFFALNGIFRDGHEFIEDAYSKGVRHFVVGQSGITNSLSGASEILVDDPFSALIALAKHHRSRFTCPIVAITGSNGKTTVKEWLSSLLSKHVNVSRSPKSYNSELGVALSLLELTNSTDVALIEVGVPGPGSMSRMLEIVNPTHGILTSFGTSHRELFESTEAHLSEKLVLFEKLDCFIYPEGILASNPANGKPVRETEFNALLNKLPFTDKISLQNARLATAMFFELGMEESDLSNSVSDLSSLALRLETFDGTNGNTIINDTYNLDIESLRYSLEYQLANANGKKRIVLIGLTEKNSAFEEKIRTIIDEFKPVEIFFHYKGDSIQHNFRDSTLLIKGSRQAKMEIIARQFKLQNHKTYLEIDLKSIRHNINTYKSMINESTKLLCMVKASSYGSDSKTMGTFLEGMGVDYLGVAYADEGVELREKGIRTPILVMNCEESSFSQCIDNNLEPAIYSSHQLDAFIKELINRSMLNYPVHIKLETGMNRLGFEESDLASLLEIAKGQPEILLKSIYSHLAESDVTNSEFTLHQIAEFDRLSAKITNEFAYPIMRHILNSSGIENYPTAQFDMVRLGIGLYGVSSDDRFRSSISWCSSISQIKEVSKNSSVGYGRAFIAERDTRIAIIPLGYADGFRRSLGRGVGGVYIEDNYCPTVGNVCMDMIMVDITGLNLKEGDRVEIIGENQTILDLADKLETIPYEIMTNFSSRLHRVFIDQ